MTAKHWLLQTALNYLGTPYIWGGDDPSGFDCSGFVLECLRSAGLADNSRDCSADALLHAFSTCHVTAPAEGCLLFTLNSSGQATHVVICLDEHFQIGADGGTTKTTDASAAWRDNAFIKIRPIRFSPTRSLVVDPFQSRRG